MKIIDLSTTLEKDGKWAPGWARNNVKYQDHRFGRLAIRLILNLPSKFLINGLGWANETIKLSTHGITHVDAPYHYSPVSENRPARTIDEMPLDWFIGNGVVLDMSHKSDGEVITPEDLSAALKKIKYKLKPGDIVLIKTGNDKYYGTREYFTKGPGMGRESTLWLIERGIRTMGIDSWGWDIPLPTQVKRAKKAGKNNIFWEAHFAGIDREYCHIERLTNLDKLPPRGFTICCFPLKIKRGSAGPSRVVAILEDKK